MGASKKEKTSADQVTSRGKKVRWVERKRERKVGKTG